MKEHFTFVVLVLVFLTAQASASSMEERYCETRDKFIHQFEKSSVPVGSKDRQALAELEQLLRLIIGPIKIKGFPKQGKINLETLQRDGGFGQVDGLRFDSDQESLVVTTDALLEDYLGMHKTLPRDFSTLSKTGDFYRRVFSWDVAVVRFVEVPIKKAKHASSAYAFLGLSAQDIGPFVPETVFVFVAKESKIFLVSSPARSEITQIPKCKNEWDQYAKKASEAVGVYQRSQLTDKKALDDSFRYEQQGFNAYRDCFGRLAKRERFFEPVTRQVQSIVGRLDVK